MKNITKYSDKELSLIFDNDENLYKFISHKNVSEEEVIDYVMDNYIYTEEQMDELVELYKSYH